MKLNMVKKTLILMIASVGLTACNESDDDTTTGLTTESFYAFDSGTDNYVEITRWSNTQFLINVYEAYLLYTSESNVAYSSSGMFKIDSSNGLSNVTIPVIQNIDGGYQQDNLTITMSDSTISVSSENDDFSVTSLSLVDEDEEQADYDFALEDLVNASIILSTEDAEIEFTGDDTVYFNDLTSGCWIYAKLSKTNSSLYPLIGLISSSNCEYEEGQGGYIQLSTTTANETSDGSNTFSATFFVKNYQLSVSGYISL